MQSAYASLIMTAKAKQWEKDNCNCGFFMCLSWEGRYGFKGRGIVQPRDGVVGKFRMRV